MEPTTQDLTPEQQLYQLQQKIKYLEADLEQHQELLGIPANKFAEHNSLSRARCIMGAYKLAYLYLIKEVREVADTLDIIAKAESQIKSEDWANNKYHIIHVLSGNLCRESGYRLRRINLSESDTHRPDEF
ncbi:hypothetical protein [Argonema antarcticum]|uniref:hypothetical protein n=1 Tax=Argonema antarcticum TaxID=2942763 RepID=UPI0020110F27|nr:hypothetical protein [Argonema antarcticum]MCL1474412.1 hypothetical protein [Argonema antarcticum A004/B2]